VGLVGWMGCCRVKLFGRGGCRWGGSESSALYAGTPAFLELAAGDFRIMDDVVRVMMSAYTTSVEKPVSSTVKYRSCFYGCDSVFFGDVAVDGTPDD